MHIMHTSISVQQYEFLILLASMLLLGNCEVRTSYGGTNMISSVNVSTLLLCVVSIIL